MIKLPPKGCVYVICWLGTRGEWIAVYSTFSTRMQSLSVSYTVCPDGPIRIEELAGVSGGAIQYGLWN